MAPVVVSEISVIVKESNELKLEFNKIWNGICFKSLTFHV